MSTFYVNFLMTNRKDDTDAMKRNDSMYCESKKHENGKFVI